MTFRPFIGHMRRPSLADFDYWRTAMPKMKTHRGAAKRFKVTKKGNLKYRKSNRAHILTKKTTKRKRQLRAAAYLADADTPRIKRLIPYK